MNRVHDMPFGARLEEDGAVRFRLWAPDARRVAVRASAPAGELCADLDRAAGGWFELRVEGLGAGALYRYRIDDEVDAPDPAARWNPQGPQGPSALLDPKAFAWSESGWRGRPWSEAVLYEMHVGAFTAEGTYVAAQSRLDDLERLGVTALEIMPLNTYAGERGWGYDGVLCYAPHPTYGSPDELKRFVQAAHERNLMVLLDVVYNHFGPQGNYLPRYASAFFTKRRHTPWGDAIDFAHPVVRSFFIENALYWLNEYCFDGLRVDAVHAMFDDGPKHFIDELVERVRAGPGAQRLTHMILENHHNEARRLVPVRGFSQAGRGEKKQRADDAARPAPLAGRGRVGASGLAQWNDDFHHALHVILTGEDDGYYIDYADHPLQLLGRVLAEGFAYQGERSAFSGEARGQPSRALPPYAFVNFLQNHDQIGNRALGERIAALASKARLRAAHAILLLAPQIPLLFMGEEYAASQPFLYFCDYEGDLATAVRDGRRNEFARFTAFAAERAREQIPDPNAIETFERSRLNWSERSREPHREYLQYMCELLRVRAQHISPRIDDALPGAATFRARQGLLIVRWPLKNVEKLSLYANLTDERAPPPDEAAALLYSSAHRDARAPLEGWEVRLMLAQS